jgi:hypothetical protein
MTSEILIDGLVRLVVKEGTAIRLFSTPSFTQIMGEMAKKVGVSLEREKITQYVLSAAEKKKSEICTELKNKFIFLKCDFATRMRTNYMGVNIQYIDNNNQAVIRTLTVTDTQSRPTSRELKTILTKTLDEFSIPLNHVLCCVTDNAASMVKLVKELSEDLAKESRITKESEESGSSGKQVPGTGTNFYFLSRHFYWVFWANPDDFYLDSDS